MVDYPRYEVKVIYRCDLCDEEHVGIARAKGGGLAQEIGSGVGKVRASCMGIAKREVVGEFMKAHPRATAKDFYEETLLAEETTVYDEKTTEKEQIGVPVTAEEIKDYVAQIRENALVSEAEKQSEESPDKRTLGTLLDSEVESSLNTGSPSSLMSFDEIYSSARKAYDNMKDEEEKLLDRLAVIRSEMKRFEDLLGEPKPK